MSPTHNVTDSCSSKLAGHMGLNEGGHPGLYSLTARRVLWPRKVPPPSGEICLQPDAAKEGGPAAPVQPAVGPLCWGFFLSQGSRMILANRFYCFRSRMHILSNCTELFKITFNKSVPSPGSTSQHPQVKRAGRGSETSRPVATPGQGGISML